MIVEHALDSCFCALPAIVSRTRAGRIAKQRTGTSAAVYRSRGDTPGISCMRGDSGEVEGTILDCGGRSGFYLNQRVQIKC